MSFGSRGLALPPPLILTSPQSATIDLLNSPTFSNQPQPQPQPQPQHPPRLIIPSAPPSSSSSTSFNPPTSSSRRAAPVPSSKGVQETRKLLHHLIDRLEERAPSEGVFEKALERERRSVGLASSSSSDGNARDKLKEEEQEETMDLVEQLRDILIISKGRVVFEEDPTQHLGPIPTTQSKSSSPVVPLLSRILPLLTSLFSHEALEPTIQPRLTRPPHALQSTLLDICTLLIHSARSRGDESTVLALGTVAMGVWAGLGLGGLGGPEVFGGGVWGERVLRFWESFLRGGFEEEREKEPTSRQERDVRAGLGRERTGFSDPFAGGGVSSMPAIQVSDASDETSGLPRGNSGWHLHASPTSPSFPSFAFPTKTQSSSTYGSLDASLSSSPPSSTSVIPSLLSHILETFPLPLKSPLLLVIFRVHSLLDLIVARKPDVSLDLLSIVAHGSSTARFGALCLLQTFWPKSMGHLNVGKALPSFEYKKDLYLYEMGRPAATEPHDRRHHWIPWIVSSLSQTTPPSSPSGRQPIDLCRSCSHPVDGFVLHCTHCLDFIHHSCYHPTSSTSVIRYPSPTSPQTTLTATLTFCKVPPTRLGPTENIEKNLVVRTDFWSGEHHFRLSNIFSLSLCGICRLPLWGATMQAYRCSGPCSLMAHPRCLASGGGTLNRCRGLKPSGEMFRIEQGKMRESFVTEFASFLISEEDLSSSSSSRRPSFEEVAVASSFLRLQLELFVKGIENGTLVLDPTGGRLRFDLHEVVERLQAALEGGGLKQSKALSELVDLERTDARILTGTQLADRIVFSRTFLSLLVLTLKSPAPPQPTSYSLSASGSSLLQVVQPDSPFPSSDVISSLSSSLPFNIVPLSHLLSQLSSTLGITSLSTSTTFLSHLHTLGAFQRQDGQSSLFPLLRIDPSSSFATTPSQDTLCSFVIPQGVDNSSVQVELLVAAIEACLSDLSVAVNEIGLGLMSKLCMPSGSSQSWVMYRLAGAAIKWMLEEEDRLILIARDFVSLSKPIPGVAEVLEEDIHGPVASSSNLSKEDFIKAAVSRGPNKVGAARALGVNDYKVARRSLIDRHCSTWLLTLHNCDRKLYAEILYKACAISSSLSDISSSSSPSNTTSPGAAEPLRERVAFADMALRNVIRLSSLDVVYSVFDEILSVWMDDISAMSTPEKPVAFKSLPRLFDRSKNSRIQSRMSTASMSDELGGFDVFTAQSVDPWRVLVVVVESGEDGLRRGIRWITVLSQSAVSIPIQNLISVSSLVATDGSFEAASEFLEACFAAAWFDPAGKQDLVLVISDLFAQHASTLQECFELGQDVPQGLRFLRRVLGSLLLLYGCSREQLQLGKFVENEGIYSDSKGVSVRTTSRYLVITGSLEVKIDVLETLKQLSERSSTAAALVGQFLLGLFTKSAQVQALDSFIDQRIDLLLFITWQLFETDVLTSTRVSLLLRILSSNSRALRGFLDAKFQESVDVHSKCATLETLFLMVMELNGEEPAAMDSDWRATVVEVFYHFFACLWDRRDERVRSKATILSASLFPPHFELVSQSWEAFLDQADSSERTRSISFLVQLHPYFPGWRILNWSVVWNLLFEEEFNVEQHSRAVGGGRSSVYELDDPSEDPASALVEAEHLRIQLLDLALLWIGDGIQIDLFSLLKVKHHVVKTIGFEHCEIVPSVDGQKFCIQFSNLDRFTPAALSVVSGLKRVLDSHHHLDLSPSAMGVYLDEDHASSHLVGAAFVDVVISVVNSKVGIKNLPYLEQRCWLECFLIMVYKHDFDSDSLAHLEAPLLEALKTITYLSPSISPDNQQIVITACKVLLDQWDEAVVAKVISRLISNISRLLNTFGLESTGPLAVQARSFIRSALKKFGERGVYLLQFKEASDPKAIDAGFDLFETLAAVFKTTSELQQVYWDVMRSLLSVNIPRPAFSSILNSLHRFAEVASPTRLSPDLIAEFGTFFSRVARHTSNWKDQDLDPNPLLSVASLVVAGSRIKSLVLLPDVFTLLQTFLARFDVKKETISQVFTACTLVSSPEERSAISILLDAAEAGLRRTDTMLPSTLGSLLECLVPLPSPNSATNPRQPTLESSRLLHLAPLALAFISSSPPHFHSNSDSVASLSAARLVLAADKLDNSILGQLLVDQLASDESPDHLRVYNWLALAALTHPTSTQARRLLDLSPFATYTCSSALSLAQRPQDPSKPDRSAEHLSAGFAFMKLWLLLARRGGEADATGIVAGAANEPSSVEGKELEIWESCWPAWERSLRLSEEETRRTPISTVLHSIFTDLCIFLSISHSSILLSSGPSLEHHLLLVRDLSSSKLVAVKLRKALALVRSGGAGETGGLIAVETAGAAEDLQATERLRTRSLGGM